MKNSKFNYPTAGQNCINQHFDISSDSVRQRKQEKQSDEVLSTQLVT